MTHAPQLYTMTPANGNIFRVTGTLRGESTAHRWIALPKASDAELWCFLWCAPEEMVEQTIDAPVVWDANALIWRHNNEQAQYCWIPTSAIDLVSINPIAISIVKRKAWTKKSCCDHHPGRPLFNIKTAFPTRCYKSKTVTRPFTTGLSL